MARDTSTRAKRTSDRLRSVGAAVSNLWQWAKANGYRYFDFYGFDTRNAKALLEGRPIADADWCKVSFYKHGFGGRIVLHPEHYYVFANPLLHAMARAFAGCRFVNRIARRLYGKSMGD